VCVHTWSSTLTLSQARLSLKRRALNDEVTLVRNGPADVFDFVFHAILFVSTQHAGRSPRTRGCLTRTIYYRVATSRCSSRHARTV
jgi:hypothetical protein